MTKTGKLISLYKDGLKLLQESLDTDSGNDKYEEWTAEVQSILDQDNDNFFIQFFQWPIRAKEWQHFDDQGHKARLNFLKAYIKYCC